MYKVDVYLRVRRAVMVEGMSVREASRVFGLHRDTVRKMLAYSAPPGYRRQSPPRKPKLEPFTSVIDRILEDDLRRPRKQRHTVKRIFERLRDEYGFDGQYTIVKDYVRTCLRSLKYDKLRRLPEGGVIMSHSYPSDISREQFARILPDLESARRRTKPRTVDLYDVFCGVLYLLKSGCQWRMLPADFPNWGTCYKYFQQWSQRPDPEQESILEQVLKKIGWRGPEKQWSERADQLLHRGLPERQEHGQRRAEGL